MTNQWHKYDDTRGLIWKTRCEIQICLVLKTNEWSRSFDKLEQRNNFSASLTAVELIGECSFFKIIASS